MITGTRSGLRFFRRRRRRIGVDLGIREERGVKMAVIETSNRSFSLIFTNPELVKMSEN